MAASLILITLGAVLLCSLAVDGLGRLTRLPRISLLVGFGVLIGPTALDLLPLDPHNVQPHVTEIALTMIAFLLGGELTRATVGAHGRAIIAVSLAVVGATVTLIGGGLMALGAPWTLALLLAGVGLATDPAAVREVARELNADGPRTRMVLGIVAIDDAWGLIAFSVILGFVVAGGSGLAGELGEALYEIGGALGIGLALGLPGAALTGRIRPGEPTLLEALGLVLLCAGLASWLEVSVLLAGMTTGCVIANLARHHERPFHEIEHVSWPFMIVFFVLAGAAADLRVLGGVLPLALGYIALRTVARVAGGWLGARIAGSPLSGVGTGLALTPQAGVALGMALVGAEAVPDVAEPLLAVAVGSTVLFEIAGPLLTRRALKSEAGRRAGSDIR
jgi:Kef-type K+ transport system membrane component KefB